MKNKNKTNKRVAPCDKRLNKNFPLLSSKLEPRDLVKVITDNGSVLVSNDQAIEYMYNQYLEGAKEIRVVMPSGEDIRRTFRKGEILEGDATKYVSKEYFGEPEKPLDYDRATEVINKPPVFVGTQVKGSPFVIQSKKQFPEGK